MTNKKDKATLITNKAKDLVVPATLLKPESRCLARRSGKAVEPEFRC